MITKIIINHKTLNYEFIIETIDLELETITLL